jgi:hypothetical protein
LLYSFEGFSLDTARRELRWAVFAAPAIAFASALSLIEAATGRRVWSEVYNAEVTNTFGVQEDIARRVVGAGSFRARRWRAFAMQSEDYIADRPRR